MANFGLSNPYIAQFVSSGVYKNGFRCGEAVNTSVTPNYNEASCHGDNKQTEYVKEFKNASVEAGVTRLPIIAKKVVFGHKIDEDKKEEISNTDDAANYVGYGFISVEMINGARQYGACVLLKVLFTEGADSYTTKGDSIAFSTPTISGNAIALENGDWRKRKFFATMQEAKDYIETILCIKKKCEPPVFDVDPGSYPDAQTVSVITATPGAKIYYTTNGLTPTKKSTEYTGEPIAVSSSMLLKAVAVKDEYADSDVVSAEYIITA